MGTSNQKQVLLGYQLLIVVSLNHYNLLGYSNTKGMYQCSRFIGYIDTFLIWHTSPLFIGISMVKRLSGKGACYIPAKLTNAPRCAAS